MKTNFYGIHPLLIACFYKQSEMIDLLVHHGSNVNIYGSIDNLCLTHFMCNDDEDIIELIAYRQNKITLSTVTPLHIACINGDESAVSSILRSRARTDIAIPVSPFVIYTLKRKHFIKHKFQAVIDYLNMFSEIKDVLPIHLACFGGYSKIVKLIVDHMNVLPDNLSLQVSALQVASFHATFHIRPSGIEKSKFETLCYSLDPLQIACLEKHWDICKVLLDRGYNAYSTFDVSEMFISCFEISDTLMKSQKSNTKVYKTSVIKYMYENKFYDLFEHILNLTEDLESPTNCVLQTLLTSACTNGELDFAKTILERFPNIDEGQALSSLHAACEHNMIAIVDFILSKNPKIDQINEHLETPLHIASKKGYKRILYLLLKKGANPFALTRTGENAYHLACKHDHVDCFSLLQKFMDEQMYSVCNDNVHFTNIYTQEKKTTTYFAYLNRNVKLLSILLSNGADINLPVGEDNETLVLIACKENCVEYVDFFLNRSADVNVTNINGETPLLIACANRNDIIIRQLLETNASVNVREKKGYCPLYFSNSDDSEITELLLKKNADPNSLLHNETENLLINAVKRQSYNTVELLLKYGADVNFSYKPGQPALYFAFENCDTKMMKCLLRYNADSKVCSHERSNYLYQACVRGMVDIVELILFHDHNIDSNGVQNNGETSLFACYKAMNKSTVETVARHQKIGRMLIRFGADINTKTTDNDTPFYQLCFNGTSDEIECILEKDSVKQDLIIQVMHDSSIQGRYTLLRTLIAYIRQPIISDLFYDIWFDAVENGQLEIIDLLIEKGLDTNMIRHTDKHSALHIASKNGNKSAVKSILRQQNTIPNIKSALGFTPLQVACLNSQVEIYESLVKSEANISEIPADGTEKNIHFACRLKDNSLIEQLCTTNSNLDYVNENGMTPLMISVCMGDERNVNVLLNAGAPKDQDTFIYCKEVEEFFETTSIFMTRATPLHIVCWKGDSRIVQQVLGRNTTCMFMHNYFNLSADEKDCDKLSPLCISVLRNNYSTVKLLLQSMSSSGLHIENSIFMSSLFNQGNRSSIECYMDNKTYLTPFQAACILDYADIAEVLLKNYVDINQRFKVTPIMLSIYAKNHELMQKVLSSNGYIDKNFEIEITPLIFAVLVGNLELLKMLLSNYADHGSEVTICLLHVIPFHENILNVLTSDYLDSEQLLLSKCTVNPFLIACLKDNNDMCNLFLSKYADPLYATQLTAMHVICFRGYDKHLKIMIEERLQLIRYFQVQCSHFIAIGNLGETNDELLILSTGCNDVLHISNLELTCFDEDVFVLKHILNILPEKSYNSVMKVTPLLLSYLFENCAQLGIAIFTSDANLCSCISYNLIISRFLYKRYGDTSQLSKQITFNDSIQLSNLSLILKFCCAGTSALYKFSKIFDAADTASVGKVIIDRVTCCDENLLTSLLLDFNENKDDQSTVSELLQHTEAYSKLFKVNFAYLLLLKNTRLDSLPLSAYNELSQEPLSFTAVEAYHLVQRRIPPCFLSSTEATYSSHKISPLIIACLHDNMANVEFILQKKFAVNQTNELSFLLLTVFRDSKYGDTLDKIVSSKNIVAKINALHAAIIMGKIEMTRMLLDYGCCVNTTAFLKPIHIPVIQKHVSEFNLEYLKDLTVFPDEATDEDKMNSILLPLEINPIHIACFHENSVDFVRLLAERQCTLLSTAKLSTLGLFLLGAPLEDSCFSLKHNTLEAFSELTPLNIASLINNAHLVEILLSKQSKIDSVASVFPLHMNVSHCLDIVDLITNQSVFMLTSLNIALLNQNSDIVDLLIEHGANVDMSTSLFMEISIEDMFISTCSTLKAIHLAGIVDEDNNFRTIISKTKSMDEKCAVSVWHLCYLEAISGVTMYQKFDREIELHLSVLHICCITKDCARVELLIKSGANCNIPAEIPFVYTKFKSGIRVFKYPLHLAAENGNLDMCILLMKYNADNEVKTNVIGFKPWQLALYHGHADVLKYLFTVRTSINKSSFMFTLLLYLIRTCFGKTVLKFLAKSKYAIVLLSFYRYLMNVLGFCFL